MDLYIDFVLFPIMYFFAAKINDKEGKVSASFKNESACLFEIS